MCPFYYFKNPMAIHPIILTIVTKVYTRAGTLSILTKFSARISIFFVSFPSRKSAAICTMDALAAIFPGKEDCSN